MCGVYLNAGREVAVASTKSFTNQCIILSLIALWFSQNRNNYTEKRQKIIEDIYNLDYQIKLLFIEENIKKIKEIVNNIDNSKFKSLFLLGKGNNEAIAKEGALKLKEVTYIHAEGYSSSALKHGPFGIIEQGLPIIILDINDEYREKNNSVYNEVIARGANVIKISDLPNNGNLIIEQNKTFGGLLANIYIQLLSYYYAVEKGLNPDFPRNLAKVVTVD
jgi:glucosamine--fructose-6-phosphate aminotransferase (isomerizing)